MSQEQPASPNVEQAVPERLSSPRAKLVWLYLAAVGECDVRTLKNALDMQLLALYPILERLETAGLVTWDDDATVRWRPR
jgi:hypothetical protein